VEHAWSAWTLVVCASPENLKLEKLKARQQMERGIVMKNIIAKSGTSQVQKRFAILITLVFLGELLFLSMANLPMNTQSEDVAIVEATQVAGAGWTGVVIDWFKGFFYNDPIQVVGAGWTGIINWFQSFIFEPVIVAGAGWTGIVEWFQSFFIFEPVVVAGAGWTGIVEWFQSFFIFEPVVVAGAGWTGIVNWFSVIMSPISFIA
jgi:hypothetical protein